MDCCHCTDCKGESYKNKGDNIHTFIPRQQKKVFHIHGNDIEITILYILVLWQYFSLDGLAIYCKHNKLLSTTKYKLFLILQGRLGVLVRREKHATSDNTEGTGFCNYERYGLISQGVKKLKFSLCLVVDGILHWPIDITCLLGIFASAAITSLRMSCVLISVLNH